VESRPEQLSLHARPERACHRSSRRWLVALATSATVGLGLAGPALGSDRLEQLPELPDVGLEIPASPVPGRLDTVPELPPVPTVEEPPVVEVATQADGGNINVSVRVLSPGTDAPVSQSGSPDLVSPSPEPDITQEDADPAIPADATSSPLLGAVNTNVSIRVLSPGDNGPVTQSNGSVPEGVSVEVRQGPSTVAEHAPAPSGGAKHSEQYQDANSQYQSFQQTDSDAWNWMWTLTMDCAGNTASTSTQTGSQTSLVWLWDWNWNWDCGAEAVTPLASNLASVKTPSSTSQKDRTAIATPSAAPSSDPWLWAWTFTFCGEALALSTQAGAGTALSWTWNWTWNWTCTPTGGTEASATPSGDAAPAFAMSDLGLTDDTLTGGEGTNSAAAAFGKTTQAPTSAGALPLPPFVTVEISPLSMPAPPTTPVEVTVDVVIPAVIPPFSPGTSPPGPTVEVTAAVGVSIPHVPRDPTEAGRAAATGRRHGDARTLPPAHAVDTAVPRQIHPSAHQHPRAGKDRADAAPTRDARGTRRHELPLDLPRRSPAVGSSSSGGVVPGALLLGVAALTGFFLLAAPGLGRRIRVARELSPRSPEQSPIDHPG
jgi:hypothetical protein